MAGIDFSARAMSLAQNNVFSRMTGRGIEEHTLVRGHWYLLRLNAEPWTAPEVGVGRRSGRVVANVYKNEQLRSYQEAVRETLVDEYTPFLHDGPIELEFYIWRQLPKYATDLGRSAVKHQADATNLQKALEDALQGVLFTNDRNVVSIHTTIMEQSIDTDPAILIGVHTLFRRPQWPYDKMRSMMRAKAKSRHPALHREVPDDDLF